MTNIFRGALTFILALALVGCGGSNGNAGTGSTGSGESGGFTLAASSPSLSVTQGLAATDIITVSDINSFSGQVSLSITGLPTGVTARFSANPTSTSAVLTFVADISATTGTSTVTISGLSNTLMGSTTISLTVVSAGSIALTPSAPALSVAQGSNENETINVTDGPPFSGDTTLFISGLPNGVTAAFGTNPATTSSVLTFSASDSATVGTYTVTVSATAGQLSASTTISLSVVVKAVAEFTLAPGALSISVAQGGSNNNTVAVADVSPFTGNVTLSASGLPSGVTATFGSNPASSGSGVTFSATSTAPAGPVTVTIKGVSGSSTATSTLTLTVVAPQTSFTGPFSWSSTAPVISAVPPMVAVKDASALYYNNQYLVYATDVDASGDYNTEYLSFTDFSQAGSAQPYYLGSLPGFSGYHTAPQFFYFTPQNTWYLIYQSGQPQYSTNPDPTKPQNWTQPQNLLNEPSGATWLDYWIICDSANCYLFFAGDNGKIYRSSTSIDNFPTQFSSPVVVLSDANQSNLFEADNFYKLKDLNLYMADVECISDAGNRFFRAFTATSLDGDWVPVVDAGTSAAPFLGLNNVTFPAGVTPWTSDFSSGGLLASYDQTDQVDPTSMQFLFQGDNTADYPAGTPYGGIPWQLGLATQQ